MKRLRPSPEWFQGSALDRVSSYSCKMLSSAQLPGILGFPRCRIGAFRYQRKLLTMPYMLPILFDAFLLTVVLIIALDKPAKFIGLVDRPNARKAHIGLIPLTGGLAIFAAYVAAVFLAAQTIELPWEYYTGLGILVLVGTYDDYQNLGAGPKLLLQIIAATIMVVPGGHVLTDLPTLFGTGTWPLQGLAIPFTIFFVVGTINAFNMLDGVDGLGGGVAVVILFWLAELGRQSNAPGTLDILLLMFATIGFLIFNIRHPLRRRAKVFLGDAGSMMLGAAIAYHIISLASGPTGAPKLIGLLWLCAIPVIDTLSLIVRRLRSGRSPMAADRLHLHHILLDFGFTQGQVAMLFIVATFSIGGLGVLGARADVLPIVMVIGLATLAAIHSFIVLNRKRWSLRRSNRADAQGVSASARSMENLGA
jgi:UDP-GlcNAc:undecaprenyl-phosphate/decaprenyl-phosphate GlcNAc-1-phosphate transferase